MAQAKPLETIIGKAVWLRPVAADADAMTGVNPADISARNTALLVLVDRARDRAAFAALFGYFAPRVKGFLLRQGVSAVQAEDLAQEAMMTVWRKASTFDPTRASASTWIFTIARNLRIDALRRERRPEFDANDPVIAPQEEPHPDAEIARVEDEARIQLVLATLPPAQAEVVRLSFFADKPHRQIATELGLPLGTVKSRLRLAMAQLKSAIGQSA